MRKSTALIEKYLRGKGHSIYNVDSFRKGMACLAEAIYPEGEDRVLSDDQLLLLSDCMNLKNKNL